MCDPRENSKKDHQALLFPPLSIELISIALKTIKKILGKLQFTHL